MRRELSLMSTLLLVITSLSCNDVGTQPDQAWSADHSAIADPTQRWQAYGVQDYSLLQIRTCSCDNGGKGFLVTVRGGSIASVVDPSDGGVVGQQKWGEFKTVTDLFELIKSIDTTRVASLTVSYDARYGYPRKVLVDSSTITSNDEFGYETEIVQH